MDGSPWSEYPSEMTVQNDLIKSISSRYSGEACQNSKLSCGNALNFAELRADESLLDIGSGRGGDVFRAAKIIGASGRIVGVDCTDAMIETAEKIRLTQELNHVEFLKAEFEIIPLADGSFDAAISNCAINHSPDKKGVFKEIFRLLKKGGRCIISDILSVEPLPQEVAENPAARAACYGGAVVENEYFHAVEEAGFRNIEILEKSEPYLKEGFQIYSVTFRALKPADS